MSGKRGRKRGALRRWLRRLLVGSVTTLLLLAAAAAWAWRALERPFPEAPEPRTVETTIVPGASARSILEQLEQEGVLRSALLARAYLVYVRGNPPLRAGEYRLELPASTATIIDRLVGGLVITYPLTIVEGLTLEETARAIAASGLASAQEVRAAVASPERIADLDAAAVDLEGYLLPDTYQFARGTSAAAIVDTAVAAFRRHYQDQLASEQPRDGTPDLRSLVILASIVEKEARLDEERPVIAAVYHNRLRVGMGLYADPTIIYAKKLAGTWDGDLRRDDLALDSPYNTYRVAGLPPGPICSPGMASLRAAAWPADVPYLFFVARNDGSHVFATTLAEHNRNVDTWQRRFFRDRKPASTTR